MNKSLIYLIAAVGIILLAAGCSRPQRPQHVQVNSPDKNIKISIKLDKNRRPVYSVSYKGKGVLGESTLGIEFRKTGLLSSNLSITGVHRRSVDSTYALVAGKADSARNNFNVAVIDFSEKTESGRHFAVVFRVYNDGIALRYFIPKQPEITNFEILSEKTTFNFPADHSIWVADYGNYNTSQETEFKNIRIDSISEEDVIGLPVTIENSNGPALAITEASLKNYAGMYLGASKAPHTLKSKLAPLPDSSGVLVRGETPLKTPWRVVMVGKEAGNLITSNIVTSLNQPSKIEDTSWIEPGKVVFPWWPDFKTDNPMTSGKLNYQNQKHYIDFASAHNIKYLEMEPPWYGPEQDVIENPLDYDITKPVPELKFFKLLEYAKKKDVKFFIWMHWKSMENQMDEALATYERWGAAGIKIDYMNRDDQQMVNFYHRLAEKAAKHHLMIYFHGAYKPTGIRRTWPNVLTREAVLGLEFNKWSKRITPEHNVTIPFTRMLAGPMDYTPGGFNNVTKEQFKVSWSNPMVMGTRAHQLAMYVVYLSPLQMVSDYPGAIANKPGSKFIKEVPSSWDDTKYIKGKIGNYIILARKKGDQWFVGAMTDGSKRKLEVPLDFLSQGEFKANIYADGESADQNPKQLQINKKTVDSREKLTIKLVSGGGWVAHLTPKNTD